jgi:hypothetical protein
LSSTQRAQLRRPSKAVWLGNNSVAAPAHTRSTDYLAVSHLTSLDSIHYVAGRDGLVIKACSIGIEIECVANEKRRRVVAVDEFPCT